MRFTTPGFIPRILIIFLILMCNSSSTILICEVISSSCSFRSAVVGAAAPLSWADDCLYLILPRLERPREAGLEAGGVGCGWGVEVVSFSPPSSRDVSALLIWRLMSVCLSSRVANLSWIFLWSAKQLPTSGPTRAANLSKFFMICGRDEMTSHLFFVSSNTHMTLCDSMVDNFFLAGSKALSGSSLILCLLAAVAGDAGIGWLLRGSLMCSVSICWTSVMALILETLSSQHW